MVAAEPLQALVDSIGAASLFFGLGGENALIEVADEERLRELRPDFTRMQQAEVQGLIVTARARAEGVDFVSRYFAPWVGINEDPVTGSAHCSLAPYWGSKLRKSAMLAHQLSARGGVIQVRLEGERVAILGQAVTVFHGTLL